MLSLGYSQAFRACEKSVKRDDDSNKSCKSVPQVQREATTLSTQTSQMTMTFDVFRVQAAERLLPLAYP
jgi:hypothetical protein